MTHTLKGTGVALVTPMTDDGEVDFNGLKTLVNFLIQGGVDYLVALGTTGEPSTLTQEERKLIFEFLVETIDGKIPLIAGIGGNSTREVASRVGQFNPLGFSAILSVSPYYNRPTQEGIFEHYKEVAAASSLPIIIYNVPARTGSNISALTTLRLAHEVSGIAGIKEASGNFDQFNEIIAGRPEGFLLLSGDDGIALPMIALGADGLISVAANALPDKISSLVHAALTGDLSTARAVHRETIGLINLFFKEGNPAGVKAFLAKIGICGDQVRLPLARASKSLKADLEAFNVKQIAHEVTVN